MKLLTLITRSLAFGAGLFVLFALYLGRAGATRQIRLRSFSRRYGPEKFVMYICT